MTTATSAKPPIPFIASAGYANSSADELKGKNHDVDGYSLVAIYSISKRTDAYIEVDNTRLKGQNVSLTNAQGVQNGAQSRNGFTIGVRHRF